MGQRQSLAVDIAVPDDSKEEVIKNHDIEWYILKNPYIIIIGITHYKPPNDTLLAVPKDVEHMRDLWLNKFKYDQNYISIITGSETLSKTQLLNISLTQIQIDLERGKYKNCDGLIFIYSGHGIKHDNGDNHIVCGDGSTVSTAEIQKKFCSENCDL